MHRRSFLATMALATLAAGRHNVFAASPEAPFDIRIGYQKSSLLAIAKKQRLIENRFGAGRISWLEFSHGPPLLEALAAGRIDYGYAGNAPPIFAQAAHAPVFYVAAQPAHGENVGIVVTETSSLRSLKDLRGRKVAVAKGSSGHDLLVAALESAGLAYTDISPVYLAPADAAAAFATGAVEAWSIWDPFLAVAETFHKARRLPVDAEVGRQNAFFLANRDFVAKHAEAVAEVNELVASAALYAQAHRDEAVTLFAAATGVPLEAEKLAVSRSDFAVVPLSETIIAQQQRVADRFARLNLIPAKIDVAEAAWAWQPRG